MSHPEGAVPDEAHWSTLKEAGTLKGLFFLLWVHRIFGRKIFSFVIVFVSLYFFLFLPRARKSSLEYLKKHYRYFPKVWKKKPGKLQALIHIYSFGQAILDKLLAWSAALDESEFDISDRNALDTFMKQKNGQLIIGSHIGNLEYCRGFVERYKNKTINALVYDQHSANFVNAMQKLNSSSRMHVYQVSNLDIPTMLQLKSKIENGEWLFIAGDRIPLTGEQRTVSVDFLGAKANLPIGPYMLGKLLQCEVQLMFSYRKNKKVVFERIPFAAQITLPRGQSDRALIEYAQQFAHALEKQVEQAPYQWFNFYPYWDKQESSE